MKDLSGMSDAQMEREMLEAVDRGMAADKPLNAVMHAAGNGHAVPEPQLPAQYGERYAQLRAELIANGEHVAAKYQQLGERYLELAAKVRQQATEAADRHIRDCVMLDDAEALLHRK